MTSIKWKLQEIKGANQGQGKIREESGNSAILFYITIIDLTANINPNNIKLET